MKHHNDTSSISHGPSVRISCINPNSSYRVNERLPPSTTPASKSMQLPTRAYSGTDFLVPDSPILKSDGDRSLYTSYNYQQTTKSDNYTAPRSNINQFARAPFPPQQNNFQQLSMANTKKNGIVSSDLDDDLLDDDTTDTLSLRTNLTTQILTEGRFSLFNNKIQQFNDEKNKGNTQSSAANLSMTTRSGLDALRPSVRFTVGTESTIQGPKNYYQAELGSPAPKENSLDEINDMLDFFEDEGSDQQESLEQTQKMPLKDYLEISQAFEKSGIESPGREGGHLPGRVLFSKEDMDEHEDLEAPDSGDEDQGIHTNMNVLKDGGNSVKLLEAEKDKMTEDEALEALRKAIFEHQVETVAKLIRKYPTLINQQDKLGNTPLNLTVKLAYKHLDFFPIAKTLLFYGANPKIKDINGWSCLDECICQADVMLLSVLFDHLINLKKKILIKQQEKLMNILNLTPDFYLEMKWDFESSIIPFFSKLAPSDTFKIWKYRKYLRMDSTLAGFKRLSIKRRDMSLIFNPEIPMPSNFKASGSLYNVNRTKSQYTNPLQDVDIEEKKYMMYDMLKADPLQGTFNIKNCQWHEHKGIFGQGSAAKINDWETKRLDFKLDMEYTLFKKAKVFFQDTYESYQNKLATAKDLPDEKLTTKDPREILNQLKQRNGLAMPKQPKTPSISTSKSPNQLQIEKINLETFENAQVTEKKQEASIWLARNFPMKFDALSPVIEFLSNGNNLLQKVESLLAREEVKSLISDNAFPVKIQVPITLSIKANITITKYELLKNPNVQDLFFIPKNFTYVERKDAQKTLLRTKKRMVLVNVLT